MGQSEQSEQVSKKSLALKKQHANGSRKNAYTKISISLTGRKLSQETKDKISLFNKTANHSIQIEAMRKANIGRKCSEEQKQKISIANKGRVHSKEQTEAHKGKPVADNYGITRR